ncbi:MAG TPA: glycoside hydrolase family 2 TIM barrel-domain containing protein [Patescibacteria group bacterium]|nr:glycoside hydrolase family 2 TIM barrel-domain containing protein [Patescibacteria group bacterium]
MYWVAGLFLALHSVFFPASAEPIVRSTISLDGTWQIAEGKLDQFPERFEHTVPVPGLVSLAQPPFVEPGPVVKDRNSVAQKDPRRDAFWYRRSFRVSSPIPAVAALKISKAMFGARAILNGQLIGDHLPSFTPAVFDVRSALRIGENELLIRVGADRDAVGSGYPNGFDYEKTRYIPGIFDSVELILSGTPHILNLQVAPELDNGTIRVQARLGNTGPAAAASLKFTVREAKSGKVISQQATGEVSLPKDANQSVLVVIPMPKFRAWSPEDPFLYSITVDTGTDRFETRFGMRSFKFDLKTKRAVLNGKPYFLRGSNVTLYRFFEDNSCGALPWDNSWVRLLHRRMKDMHWNCLRYCIGFPPESWYRIADEEGILLQDEFPIWYGGTGWSKWPEGLKNDELALEYTEWVKERWNHPSVVIWDASNETSSLETGLAVQRTRGLDLSGRPWDNSYGTPRVPGDVFESHPYHFQNPKYKLSDLAKEELVPQGNALRNPGDSPVVINEYGWLWLNRDGTPTTLTQELYQNLLGTNSTTAQRRHLYARYLAAETEFWRCHRQAAAVLHFTALGYSRSSGQTSDHWLNLARLEWEPEFAKYVRDAFAPVGLMIDDWAESYEAGKPHGFSVVVINDENHDWKGTIRLRLLNNGRAVQEFKQKGAVQAFGRTVIQFSVLIPLLPGSYQVEAVLDGPGGPVRSLRDFTVTQPSVSTALR